MTIILLQLVYLINKQSTSMLTGDQEKVRKVNKSIILICSTPRSDLSCSSSKSDSLNRSTVSNIVNVLIDEDWSTKMSKRLNWAPRSHWV
jgi:hypothetical protein